jgi:hypothetical protein
VSLGLLTGIVVFGFTGYVIYKVIKKLNNVLSTGAVDSVEKTTEFTGAVDSVENTTEPVDSVENTTEPTGAVDSVEKIPLCKQDYTFVDVDSIYELNQSITSVYNNNYILLGGQNYFNNIINTSNNIGFGKTLKHLIWYRRMVFGNKTDAEVLSHFNIKGEVTTDILNIHNKGFTTFLFDIMPLVHGDRWITNPISPVNCFGIVESLVNYTQYNDVYIDIIICNNTNFKSSHLNSFFYLSIDGLNAYAKLQEIMLAIANSGGV